MLLQSLSLTDDGAFPGELLTGLTALYASHRAVHALSGRFPDPDDIRPEQVAAALADELARPGAEVLVGRSEGRLVGVVVTLAGQDAADDDPDPWIGLLMVDAEVQRQGYGRQLATLVEERYRAQGRSGLRLAVPDGDRSGLAFWQALGYRVIDHRRDPRLGRPFAVLRKPLRTPRRAARVAVLDPAGAVFLFRYDNVEVGVHWALPGGGIEGDETPREGALRELTEETGWTDLRPGPLLCTWEHDFTHSGIPVHQHEHVYVTHGPHREPTASAVATAHAEDGILTWRWWPREELAHTAEAVWPPELARLLHELEEGELGAWSG